MASTSESKLRPRILKYILNEMEKQGIPNRDVQYKENQKHKDVQVEFTKKVDTLVYSRTQDGGITGDVDNLPNVPFYETQPDDCNKCFARLIAFELQRVPLEQRSMLYIEVIDMVRRARGGFELNEMSP
ncbi:hypothetical protein O0L34_g17490 [Tuta absoluta]|nr:hypothetical protein O0L34_g17490 [Tuta absoluta]